MMLRGKHPPGARICRGVFDRVFRNPDPPAPTEPRNEPTVDTNKEVVPQTSEPAVGNEDPENEDSERPHNPIEDAALNQRLL